MAFTVETESIADRVADQATQDCEVLPSVQVGQVIYHVSTHIVDRSKRGALVDRGANGGILGDDARVILQHKREVDVTGIDNHELNALKIVDASAVAQSQNGPVIVIMRQYAYHGQGRTIHSSAQVEHFKNKVDDRSMKVGGTQCIRTNDGFVLPLDIINGLPYLKMHPNSDQEFEELPHVILTAGTDWDPTVIDHTLTDKEDWYDTLADLNDGIISTPFDEFGNYRKREVPAVHTILPDLGEQDDIDEAYLCELSFKEAFHEASNLNRIYVCHEAALEDPTENVEVVAPEVKKKPIDYAQYSPYFLHCPIDKIKHTMRVTTQHAANVMAGNKITQTLKSPNPANNVWRRNEPVATDTIFAEVPAVDSGGQTMAQIFVGRKSLAIDVYGMGTEKEFVNTLEDVIRRRGAMDKLISDSARVEISARVKDILRALCIDDWQSEPNYQHENFAELRWKHLKKNVQWFMNLRNVDPSAWLLCTQWVADVMNHTAEKSLGWRPPLQVLTGQTIDISILLCFLFWDVVYCERYEDHQYKGQVGSTKSSEIRGRFVGFGWHVGHALTFKILTDDTKKIIYRSRVRLAAEGVNNLKLDTEAGQVPERIFIKSKRDSEDLEDSSFRLPTIDMSSSPFAVEDEPATISDELDRGEKEEQSNLRTTEDASPDYTPMDDPPLKHFPTVETVTEEEEQEDLPPHLRDKRKPGDPNPEAEPFDFAFDNLKTDNPVETFNVPPEEMIDRTFLMPPAEDGSRVRAKIVERVQDMQAGMESHPERIKFRCLVNDEFEEIVAYNDIVDYIEQDQTWDGVWKFRKILSHQGPLSPRDPKYKGSRYNLLIEWETGEKTWEPLSRKDKTGVYDTDPVTVAIYAEEQGLLDEPGWKLPGLRKMAKTRKRIIRLANQAKLHSFRTKPIYMYGFQVPRNHDQAMELDRKNGNTKWRDAEIKEVGCIDEYDVFLDKGKGYRPPEPEYKKIRVHMVYAVKHDGRHRARLVAGGHLTDTPVDSVYSSVVSLRGVRILAFLAELNDLELWSTDISSAYLESFTKEKVYIIAGGEFGEREGHTLIIVKALYGLKTSGVRWHK